MQNSNREKVILKHFQKKHRLVIGNKQYQESLIELFQWLLKADEVKNDITTKTLDLKNMITATIIAKQDGIVAGLEEVAFLSKLSNISFSCILLSTDREHITINQPILQITGPARTVLSYERTVLNILGRMSGIATNTQQLVNMLGKKPLHIASTRKTLWGLIDKKAIATGGGITHRLNLSDEIMIKDNHLKSLQKEKDFFSPEETIEYVVEKMCKFRHWFLELEVETLSQAQTAIKAFAMNYELRTMNYCIALLLDNWKPIDVKQFINEVKKTDIYNHIVFEASGDITEENINDWKTTGADILSLGYLTHSAKNFNLSMNF